MTCMSPEPMNLSGVSVDLSMSMEFTNFKMKTVFILHLPLTNNNRTMRSEVDDKVVIGLFTYKDGPQQKD